MQRSNTIFRNHVSFGYLTDNRNFGYHRMGEEGNYRGDKIISESGAVFFSALQRIPKNLDELMMIISNRFIGVDVENLKEDVVEFYNLLEADGFIASGQTFQECTENDKVHSTKINHKTPYKNVHSDGSLSFKKSTQQFLEEFYNGKPQLTHVHIEVTSRCNERCVHCYLPHNLKNNDMSLHVFSDILEQCYDMNVLHLTLSGGEPMLHNDFCQFLKICREYNFSVNVLSNLTMLNDEILREMKMNPMLGVQVSLYSMDPEIHDEITQVKGSFRKTIDAITKLTENGIVTQISCPILKQNKNSYHEVVRWAERYKISVSDDFVIIARSDHSIENLHNRLTLNEVEEIIRNMAKNNPEYLTQIQKEVERKRDTLATDFVCSVCHSSICIGDTGKLYPCAGWQDFSIGDIRISPLKEIWENSRSVQYLRNLREQDFTECQNCPDKEFCTKCLVRNANEDPNGDPLAINEYFCDIAKINRKVFHEFGQIINSAL